MDQLPQDPVMLMSVINTRLRDNYTSLQELCYDLHITTQDIESRLHAAGFTYIPEINQFR